MDAQPWVTPRRHRLHRSRPVARAADDSAVSLDIGSLIGPALIALGVVGLGYALAVMDVSVEVGFGQRVANLELMNRRQVYVIASGFLLAIGVFLTVMSRRDAKP